MGSGGGKEGWLPGSQGGLDLGRSEHEVFLTKRGRAYRQSAPAFRHRRVQTWRIGLEYIYVMISGKSRERGSGGGFRQVSPRIFIWTPVPVGREADTALPLPPCEN